MRNLRDTLIIKFDFLIAMALIPAARFLRFARAIGIDRFVHTRKMLLRVGIFPVIDHYYEPLFNPKHLRFPLDTDRNLPGIELNENAQLALLEQLYFSQELRDLALDKTQPNDLTFHFKNYNFESGDAEFLYQFIRHTKPLKVIEIGSGSSTKVTRMALDKNRELHGVSSRLICIEPYEAPCLEKLDAEIIRKKLEDCPLSLFEQLERGDLLFIDSSHMIRPQGDVLREYLEILPILKPGVNIHIHDIFTPKDYPKPWVCDTVRFWNEQYLLEALLSHTNRYEVLAALNFLRHHHYDRLKSVCPYLTEDREPGSFYLRVMQPA